MGYSRITTAVRRSVPKRGLLGRVYALLSFLEGLVIALARLFQR